jgi:DNA topoisomerase-1
MQLAQKLYEAGHITYMRTDSTNLSESAIGSIAAEIESQFGKEYVQIRRYKTTKSHAQEAHEAIRPTYIQNAHVTSDRDQQRLYELIWKRTIASQMAEAVLERTIVKIAISTIKDAPLIAEGEVLKFDGFLKVYLESKDDDDEEETTGMLPPVKVGQVLDLESMTATEKFTRPPSRYTEASLVSKLEELGIGRPSTYAPTISKIMEENRGYVVKHTIEGETREFVILCLKGGVISKSQGKELTGASKSRLQPTDMGMIVTDFLLDHFKGIMDYGFTAGIEEEFDIIAEGKLDWHKMVGEFYHPFHDKVQNTLENSLRATGERELGKDPESGKTVIVRMTRFGKPAVQIGSREELGADEKPKYANLNPGMSIETITLEEALKLFVLPKVLGDFQGKEVSVGSGRFGPYVKFGDQFVSIPRSTDPLEMELDAALALIKEKQSADAPIGTYKGLPITKGKGRFGPFIKWNDIFINVPKKYNLDTLSIDVAHKLIESKLDKEANRYVQRWEKENISIENGRWGPFIRFKKASIAIPKINGKKATADDAAALSLTDVKEIIENAKPGSFKK